MWRLSVLVVLAAGCSGTAGNEWVKGAHAEDRGWSNPTITAERGSADPPPDLVASNSGELLRVDDYGGSARAVVVGGNGDLFRNTYYDFPKEGAGTKDATVFDAACAPIARVTKDFHDKVCVQGSGKLSTGETVSFAKRDCECAAVCPRTSQKVCFEKLDAVRFPSGRGATGKPITPLLTVAVDSTVIPLGTPVFIPEMAGMPRGNGKKHDGCFLAEDRGLQVVGKQVDIFTGDPAVTAQWNALVPSNRGVTVLMNDPRCTKVK